MDCSNNCNGKGNCVNSKCECIPGSYGIDCSLTLLEFNNRKLLKNEYLNTLITTFKLNDLTIEFQEQQLIILTILTKFKNEFDVTQSNNF